MAKRSPLTTKEGKPTAIEMAAGAARRDTATASSNIPTPNSGLTFQVTGVLGASTKITEISRLGDFVSSRRKARNLSQQEFADLAGVGRRFVSEIKMARKPRRSARFSGYSMPWAQT